MSSTSKNSLSNKEEVHPMSALLEGENLAKGDESPHGMLLSLRTPTCEGERREIRKKEAAQHVARSSSSWRSRSCFRLATAARGTQSEIARKSRDRAAATRPPGRDGRLTMRDGASERAAGHHRRSLLWLAAAAGHRQCGQPLTCLFGGRRLGDARPATITMTSR